MIDQSTILVTGHLGYVGSVLIPYLRKLYPSAKLIGVDTGFFKDDLLHGCAKPEEALDQEINCDVRSVTQGMLDGVDSIIHLAAVSNDPIGSEFAAATHAINYQATVRLASLAKKTGVSSFIFASSCSIYGATSSDFVDEKSEQNPLTDYAKSKVAAEAALVEMANEQFYVTSLRFGTACGFSPRLRLDLVVNDFQANALALKKIHLLSAGNAWRPFVHVEDMAKAMDWARQRVKDNNTSLIVNVGSEAMTTTIKSLAELCASVNEDIEVVVSKDAQPDKRSYNVSFDKFRQLAPGYQPYWSMENTFMDLKKGLLASEFCDQNFRLGKYMRLNKLQMLISNQSVNKNLILLKERS